MGYVKFNTGYNPSTASVRTDPAGKPCPFKATLKPQRTRIDFSVHPNPEPRSNANRLMAAKFADEGIIEGDLTKNGIPVHFKQAIKALNTEGSTYIEGQAMLKVKPAFEYASVKLIASVHNATKYPFHISTLGYSYDRSIGQYATHPNLASDKTMDPNSDGDWDDVINYAAEKLPATTKISVSMNSEDLIEGSQTITKDVPLNKGSETLVIFDLPVEDKWTVRVGETKDIPSPEAPPEVFETQKMVTWDPELEEQFKFLFADKTYVEAVKILNDWRDSWISKHSGWRGEIQRSYDLAVELLPERAAPTLENLDEEVRKKLVGKTKAEALGILTSWAQSKKYLYPALSDGIDKIMAEILGGFEAIGVQEWDAMTLSEQHDLMNKCGEGLKFGEQDKYYECLAKRLGISTEEAKDLKSHMLNFSEILAEATAFLGVAVLGAAVIATIPINTLLAAFQSKQAKTPLTMHVDKIIPKSVQATIPTATKGAWAAKVLANPNFKLLGWIAIITMAFWNLTDPIWWQSAFKKMRGDNKERFEKLRIDVSTKMKQAHNLVHINPTDETLAEALTLLRVTKPLIIELFEMLDQPDILTEIQKLYPEFEKEVEAFIVQYNELVRGSGGTSADFLSLGEIKAPTEQTPSEIAASFDPEFTILSASVEDGDTLNFPDHPEVHNSIRMLGIDTHELSTDAGKEEAEYLKSLIEGKTVQILVHQHKDPDMMLGLYGRLLGGVKINGSDVALLMLEKFGEDILTQKKYRKKYRWIDWDEYERVAKKEPDPDEVGELKFNTKPTYAKIIIDGKDTDLLTAEIVKNIPLGLHDIKLTLFGYKDYKTTVDVSEPKRYEVYHAFKKEEEEVEEEEVVVEAEEEVEEEAPAEELPTIQEFVKEIEGFYVGRMYMSKTELQEIGDKYDLLLDQEYIELPEEQLPTIQEFYNELWTYYVDRMYLSKTELADLKLKYGFE